MKNRIVIALICFAAAGVLFYLVPWEYRIAIIACVILLLMIEHDNLIFFARIGQQLLELFFVRVILPPMALLLWALDYFPFAKMVTPIKGARSRAELKQCWVDSWLTAPARFIRSRNKGG